MKGHYFSGMEGCFPLPPPMFVPRFCDKTITLTYLCSQTQDLCLCILAICRISFTQGLAPRKFYKPFVNKNAACWNQRFNVIRSQRGLVRRGRKTRFFFNWETKKIKNTSNSKWNVHQLKSQVGQMTDSLGAVDAFLCVIQRYYDRQPSPTPAVCMTFFYMHLLPPSVSAPHLQHPMAVAFSKYLQT